jgi:hypothetical protein
MDRADPFSSLVIRVADATWAVTVAASIVAAGSNVLPVVVALLFAVPHFVCALWLLRRPELRTPTTVLVYGVPLLLLTLDNAGRMVHILGGPLVRIL